MTATWLKPCFIFYRLFKLTFFG